MHKLYAFLCLFGGGALSWAGWKILRPYNRPPDTTGFAGPIIGRPLLVALAGNLLFIFGIVIAVLFTLIFLLT
jgi:hypothetical protein